MAVKDTHISWTTSTWNPTTGCTKISAGCDNCYAENITRRFQSTFANGFNLTMHPNRLSQSKSFTPRKDATGLLEPCLVFVNSMSDIFHKDIPEAFLHKVFDSIESNPKAIFQLLTKRPMLMKQFIEQRYKNSIPKHIWLGASVENSEAHVIKRIDILRKLKDKVGNFTAFLSVEPLIGPADKHNYENIEWVLIGGESGPNCRPLETLWARQSRDEARRCNSAIWFKQYGDWKNNPYIKQAPPHLKTFAERKAWVIINGLELQPGEKGGATLDGEVLHEYPPYYHELKHLLNLPDADKYLQVGKKTLQESLI